MAAAMPRAQAKLNTPAMQNMTFFCWAGMAACKVLSREGTKLLIREQNDLHHISKADILSNPKTAISTQW